MDDQPKTIKDVVIEQIGAHIANFIYIMLGIFVFVVMYLMKDSMYSKEVGMVLLGYIGILINGGKYNPPAK